ncbi:MAG: citrate lyase holo-[acyl-carrier protein] synthase [Bacillota bacterium]
MRPVTEEAILRARKRRADHAVNASRDFEEPVVLLKVNIPGSDKNPPVARPVLKLAARLLFELFDVSMQARVPSVDGDYHVMVVDAPPRTLKKVAVYLEDTHRLGRLFDIDVHAEGRKLSRVDLGHAPRKCLICGGDVLTCRRSGAHSQHVLLGAIHSTVHRFLLDALSEEAVLALRKELYMKPCFALVGPLGSGRHRDMNFTHFLTSIEALRPYFRLYLDYGSDLCRHLDALRKAGRKGEQTMLEATGGINTHKGAHFIFGLALPVFMHSLLNGESMAMFKANLKDTAAWVLRDDFKHLKKKKGLSKGERLYAERGIAGIRGEAKSGFNSVFEWYPEDDGDDLKTLIRIIGRLEDTTLYRENADGKTIRKAFKACEANGFEDLDSLYDAHRHISPGGAADMLALVYFLRATDYLLNA